MKSKAAEVFMESPDGKSRTEVNNNESVAIMEGQGWKVVGDVPGKKVKAAEPVVDTTEVKTTKTGSDETTEKKPASDNIPDYSDFTKDDLKELLDAKKIPYEAKATKADLIEALTAGSK